LPASKGGPDGVRWALASALVSLGSVLLAGQVKVSTLAAWTFGMIVAAVSLQLGELRAAHTRTPLLSTLELSLTDPELSAQIQDLVRYHFEVEDQIAPHGRCADLFRDQRRESLSEARTSVRELARGHLEVRDSDKQFKFAVDLAGLAERTVETVSYRDEDFWKSQAGDEYFRHNQSLVASGGSVVRVFVFESDDDVLDNEATILRHIDAGFTVYILPDSERRPADEEDFVIYDGSFVRYAEPLSFRGSEKRATLSVDDLDIQKYSRRFDDLRLRCRGGREFLQQLKAKLARDLAAHQAHDDVPEAADAEALDQDPIE
jgi:hypothetical protein